MIDKPRRHDIDAALQMRAEAERPGARLAQLNEGRLSASVVSAGNGGKGRAKQPSEERGRNFLS
jgi:hypothetical protein